MPRLTPRALLRGDIGRLNLTSAEALVLLTLMDRADRDDIAFPSQTTIGDALGLSRQGVAKIIDRLADRGLIEIAEKGRQHRSARYRIIRDPKPEANADDV